MSRVKSNKSRRHINLKNKQNIMKSMLGFAGSNQIGNEKWARSSLVWLNRCCNDAHRINSNTTTTANIQWSKYLLLLRPNYGKMCTLSPELSKYSNDSKNLNFFSCIAVFAIIAFELSCFSSTGLMVIKILLSSKAMYYDTIIRVANYAITGD